MRFIVPSILIVLSVIIQDRDCFAQNPPFEWPSSYTIEYVQKAPGDPVHDIYSVSGNKARNEITYLKQNNTLVTILDLDKQVMISYIPSSNVYQESSTKDIGDLKIRHLFDPRGTWEKVLSEKLDGVDADKYKLTPKEDFDKYWFVWISPKTSQPLKLTNYNGTWLIEVNRYVPGPVEDHLFIAPSGYKNNNGLSKQ